MRAFLSRDTRAEAEVGLGRLLPGVPPSERALAFARGLGLRSAAALSAALSAGEAAFPVDDAAFAAALGDHAAGLPSRPLTRALLAACVDVLAGDTEAEARLVDLALDLACWDADGRRAEIHPGPGLPPETVERAVALDLDALEEALRLLEPAPASAPDGRRLSPQAADVTAIGPHDIGVTGAERCLRSLMDGRPGMWGGGLVGWDVLLWPRLAAVRSLGDPSGGVVREFVALPAGAAEAVRDAVGGLPPDGPAAYAAALSALDPHRAPRSDRAPIPAPGADGLFVALESFAGRIWTAPLSRLMARRLWTEGADEAYRRRWERDGLAVSVAVRIAPRDDHPHVRADVRIEGAFPSPGPRSFGRLAHAVHYAESIAATRPAAPTAGRTLH